MITFYCNPLKNYRITSEYGNRIHPITKKLKFHPGIDLVSHYDYVYAVSAGKVVKQGWNKQRGNYVVIQHNGFATLYQHLDSYVTKQGEMVDDGEFIGCMGSTGASTGEHLHFELYIGSYYNGIKVNPKPFLRKE